MSTSTGPTPQDLGNAPRRVLVIAYYFPPMAYSGVQRVLKFVKYLPQHGWRPTVLTVDPAGYYQFDETMESEIAGLGIDVHRVESSDPTRLFGRKHKVEMPGEKRRRVASMISQSLFIPDNKIGWKRAAVKKGIEILQAGEYDAIFSSAPPYTAHLIGMELSRRSDVPLVTDFRDDWVGNPRHFYLTAWHKNRHQLLESEVIKASSAVTVINRPIHDRLIVRNLGPEGYHKVSMIPQGYDADDFNSSHPGPDPKQLRLTYTGIFYDVQTPEYFLKALSSLLERRPELRKAFVAEFVGHLPKKELQRITDLGLDKVVEYKGYLPHRESVERLQAADILWMTVGRRAGNETISTGKLFEYMGARKPILGLVPQGAAADALERYGAFFRAAPDDPSAIAAALESLYEAWRRNDLPTPNESFAGSFDRSKTAGTLARVLLSTIHADSIL
ncbi:glycosyltransferase family 4 protein [Bacteroidota bacterium]